MEVKLFLVGTIGRVDKGGLECAMENLLENAQKGRFEEST